MNFKNEYSKCKRSGGTSIYMEEKLPDSAERVKIFKFLLSEAGSKQPV